MEGSNRRLKTAREASQAILADCTRKQRLLVCLEGKIQEKEGLASLYMVKLDNFSKEHKKIPAKVLLFFLRKIKTVYNEIKSLKFEKFSVIETMKAQIEEGVNNVENAMQTSRMKIMANLIANESQEPRAKSVEIMDASFDNDSKQDTDKQNSIPEDIANEETDFTLILH
ncbi:unnamed protein product [Moneuplotes crassus]|uniref:Uncharacterized protein n=1 Tax=Euplotes crassus TaxID=5936 RepID=A0AAD2D771_EUPCR|nr:unnamed protein product [Moneuplotes crassus]